MNTPAVQTIRGYELHGRIGEGGFGEVYRAYQPSVGREVAIKVVLPEYANHPDFIRRFETEAQLVARLEHLHIVPLYDYWREPDGAYLVMRWLRGGNLGESLRRGPWTAEAAAQLLDQVASALAVAHRQGVVHRDVKPENILLDEEGNAYLSDFGIAKDLMRPTRLTKTDVIVGSPAYISPEQARDQPLTAQSDLYSLGVVMYETLTGQHPFPGVTPAAQLLKHVIEPLPPLEERRPDLPKALEDVIQRATAKKPAERYPDVLAFAVAFRGAVSGAVAEAITRPMDWAPLEMMNPYKGLRAFEEADAADFFGREVLTKRLLARLSEEGTATRFLAVVGPSGSGKSSVVKAGLLPALRRGALPGSEKWFVVQMLPGEHPLEELEIGLLRIAVNRPSGLMEQLRRDERGLLRAVRLVLPTEDGDQRRSELLLVVDQFEELFTRTADRAESEHFLQSLCAAVSDPRSRVRVIITLRADFYDRPLMQPRLCSLMRQRTEVVVPLTAEELAQAIREPAEQAGAKLETGLVTAIVADVSEQPGALPMLQYALTELFERREGRLLTRQAYQAIGGVSGALARRAEEVYAGLEAAGQTAARQLFLRLVTLGEGTEDTRRRVLRGELRAVKVDGEAMDAVIGAFGRSRLLLFDRDPATRAPTVEVAHEALLREWARLGEWLDESRADVRMQRLLGTVAGEWILADRDPSFLLRGTRLAQFEGWAAGSAVALTQDEHAFLQASIAERQAREAAEAARQHRELEAVQRLAEAQRQRAEAERARAEEQAQAAGRLKRGALLLAGMSIIAIVLAVVASVARQQATRNADTAQAASTRAVAQRATAEAEADSRATAQAIAVQERETAQRQARLATSRELAAAALSNLKVDPERSVLLALQAASVAETLEAENALHRAVLASRVRLTLSGHTDMVNHVAFSPDGTRLATTSADGTGKVWDMTSGQELLTLVGHTGAVMGLAFSPDGTRLATASHDGTAKVWDAETGQELLTLFGHAGPVVDVSFGPDGTRLATASEDETARIWDGDSGQELLLFDHAEPVTGVAFSPDGTCLATGGDDDTARIWDIRTGRELLALRGHASDLRAIAFSPNGTRLATASYDNTARVWDLEAQVAAAPGQAVLAFLARHASVVLNVAFSPDGTRLATSSADGTAKVWDMTSGRELLTLSGHAGIVMGVAFSPDGTRLATGSFDGTAKVWDLSPEHELLTLVGHTDEVFSVAFSPDGTRLATGSGDGTARVWDVSALLDTGLGAPVATASGNEFFVLPEIGQIADIQDVAFSPDGKRLVTANADGTATVWDVSALLGTGLEASAATSSGQALFTLTGHAAGRADVDIGGVTGAAFSPDGRHLATASDDGTAKIWDATTGQELLTLRGHAGGTAGLTFDGVVDVAFSPDGAHLATAGADGTVKVWDVSALLKADLEASMAATGGQELFTLSGHTGFVIDVAFSPDGARLVTGGFDATARVWDAVTGQELLTLSGHTSSVFGVAFSPDGTRLATGSLDGTVKVWDAVTGQELLSLVGHTDGVFGVAFSPDGARLAAAGRDGTVRVYVLPIEELVALAQSRLTRTLTTEECQRYLHLDRCPDNP